MNLTFRLLLTLLLLSCHPVVHAAYVALPNGELTDQHKDLSVKVLGGHVALNRTWANGRWYFNPAWSDLKFKRNVEGDVEYVDRAGAVYERTGNQDSIYVFDDTQFIRRVLSATGVESWRWYNRTGASVNYDAAGLMQGYVNRNGVKVSFVRGLGGRIDQVNDHFGNLALAFSYTANKLTNVRDRSNRTVSYTWTGERLSEVTDVLQYVWKYGYDSNGQLNRIEDPELQVTNVTYIKSYPVQGLAVPLGLSFSGRPGRDFRISRVGILKNAKGEETTYDFEYNRAQERFVVIEKSPAPLRRRVERQYDLQGRMLSEENGSAQEFERRRDGPLIDYVKDERGLITRTERDAFRNVVKVTHADGFSESWKYHPSYNFVTESTDGLGRIDRYQYSAEGNLIEALEAVGTPEQRRMVYSYDNVGQLKTATIKGPTLAEDATTEYFYDAYGNQIKTIDAENQPTEFLDFDVMGNAREQKDALGHVRKMRYNAAGWLLGSETALGYQSDMAYNKVGSRLSSSVQLENNQRATTLYRYDALDRLVETEDALGGISKQRYDAEGRMLESLDARSVKTKLEYDARGRMMKMIDGKQNETETVYGDATNALEGLVASRIYPTYQENYLYDERDRQTRVEQVLSPTLRYTSSQRFDALGNVVSMLDAKGRSSQRFYDGRNRLIKEIDPTLGETTYSYDVRDNLLSVTDANGHTHRFSYDKLNRKLTEKRPMGQTIGYQYDAIGQLTLRTSPNGAKRKYTYDADDRLIKEEYFQPPPATNPPPNPAPSKTNTFTYFADDRDLLKGYADGITAGSYQYDKKGQKLSETITFATNTPNPISKTITRTYEANGLLKTFAYPGAVEISEFTYDSNNQLTTYKVPSLAANNDTLTYSYRWSAISEITMPGNLKRTVTLDPLLRPSKIEVKGFGPTPGNNGVPVMNHRYDYDATSNITKKTTLDGEYLYGYDELDRLIKATPSPQLQQQLPVEAYTYDAVHNRESSVHQPGVWSYNANNELLSWGNGADQRTLTYDANGSTIKEEIGVPVTATTDYVYDAQDRLVEVKKNAVAAAKYAYDAMGRRIKRETFGADAGTTWFLYSDEGLIEEISGANVAIRTYGWNPGGMWGTDTVWQKDQNGTFLTNNDHLYTTDVLTNATDGVKAWAGLRESFGKTVVQAGAGTKYLMRFPGQWEDGVGGFNQNWHREAITNSGGYLQGDLIDTELGWKSIYVYSLANPIVGFDFTGLFLDTEKGFCSNPVNVPTCIELGRIPRRPPPLPESNPNPRPPIAVPKPRDGENCPTCATHPVLMFLMPCNESRYLYTSLKQAMSFDFPDGKEHGRKPTTKGDCTGLGSHWNVRSVGDGANLGSVFSCPCCEDTAAGPTRKERFKTTRALEY
jgi:YD repeat-containing protein